MDILKLRGMYGRLLKLFGISLKERLKNKHAIEINWIIATINMFSYGFSLGPNRFGMEIEKTEK